MSAARRTGGTATAIALAALALAACGDDDAPSGEALASLVPADTVVYAEGAVRPEGDQRAAIEAIAARFPGGEDLGDRIVESLDESLSGADTEATWEEDIEPWLGDRAAVALSSIEPDPDTGDPPITIVVRTDDAADAAESLGDLNERSEDPAEEVEADGATYYTDQDAGALGVVGDHLLFTSTEADFTEAAEVVRGEGAALGDDSEFSYEVGDVDGSGALAFASLALEPLIQSAIAADGTADLEAEQLQEIYESASFDLSQPLRVALNATESTVTVDAVGGAPEGEAADSPAPGELLGSLPGDSTLAGTCDACLEGFRSGFEIGLTEAAGEDGVSPEEAREAVRERLGLDLDALADALGSLAFFARGSSVFDVGGALVIEVEDRAEVARALDAAETIVATEGGDVEISDLPSGLPEGAEGFSVSPSGIPVAVNAVLTDDRLVLAFGEQATLDALEPSETLAGSAAMDAATEALGEGFAPSAIADLDALFGLLGSIPASGELEMAKPYLEPFAGLYAGGRTDDELTHSRTVIEFD